MFDFTQIAAEFGGQTDKLLIGQKPYEARTVSEMVENVVSRINETVVALEAYDVKSREKLVSPMAQQVRNGFAVKIGYGVKNEKLEGADVQNFWLKDAAIASLKTASEQIAQGALNDSLDMKLESYRERAEAGKLARRAA
mgnify:FL=1